MVCNVDAPSLHDPIAGQQLPASTGDTDKGNEWLPSSARSSIGEQRKGRTGSWIYFLSVVAHRPEKGLDVSRILRGGAVASRRECWARVSGTAAE